MKNPNCKICETGENITISGGESQDENTKFSIYLCTNKYLFQIVAITLWQSFLRRAKAINISEREVRAAQSNERCLAKLVPKVSLTALPCMGRNDEDFQHDQGQIVVLVGIKNAILISLLLVIRQEASYQKCVVRWLVGLVQYFSLIGDIHIKPPHN